MRTKIELRDLWKSFPTKSGALRVVEGIDLSVGEGELVVIVGPSGCGKSTLMSMTAGFVPPDRGSILIDGVEHRAPNAKAIMISQQGSVFPWLTVQRNLMFGLAGRPQRERIELADHYAALVGLTGFEHAYPHELSGGMLKRAELARALVMKPDILVMDEPFSALDALLKLRMRKELRRILDEERHTVLLVTHDVEEAIDLADRVLVLSPRPTRIQATFEIKLPHPRQLIHPQVQTLRVAILGALGLGDEPAEADQGSSASNGRVKNSAGVRRSLC